MSSLPDVHIVQVNYFSKDDILRSLESLFASHETSGINFIVTIVDNTENKDGIREALAENFPSVRYIDAGGNIGFGRGNNLGFQAERARYYFALNPDTALNRTPHLLKELVDYLDNNPRVGAVGPKILYEDGEAQDSIFRFDFKSLVVKPLRHTSLRKHPLISPNVDRLLMHDHDRETIKAVDWVLGAALMVRDEAAQNVGFFDPRFFLYLEDCDWCRRLWERGWEVHYLPKVELTHRYKRDSSSNGHSAVMTFFKKRTAREHLKSWFRYLWKWRGHHTSYVR